MNKIFLLICFTFFNYNLIIPSLLTTNRPFISFTTEELESIRPESFEPKKRYIYARNNKEYIEANLITDLKNGKFYIRYVYTPDGQTHPVINSIHEFPDLKTAQSKVKEFLLNPDTVGPSTGVLPKQQNITQRMPHEPLTIMTPEETEQLNKIAPQSPTRRSTDERRGAFSPKEKDLTPPNINTEESIVNTVEQQEINEIGA